MILAAGLGSRMQPLSSLRAKPALPVLNRPLLHWTLERLARHGVTDVVVNLHHLPETVTGRRSATAAHSAFASSTPASARSSAREADRARCASSSVTSPSCS